MFIPLMRLLLCSLVLCSFLVFQGYSLIIFFFHLRMFDGVRFQYSQVFVSFIFSERYNFSWFGCSIPSVICRFPLFIIIMAYFSMSNSIPISSLPVFGFPILFHVWQTVWCSPLSDWFFFLRLVKFVSSGEFPMYVTQWHHRYHKQ